MVLHLMKFSVIVKCYLVAKVNGSAILEIVYYGGVNVVSIYAMI